MERVLPNEQCTEVGIPRLQERIRFGVTLGLGELYPEPLDEYGRVGVPGRLQHVPLLAELPVPVVAEKEQVQLGDSQGDLSGVDLQPGLFQGFFVRAFLQKPQRLRRFLDQGSGIRDSRPGAHALVVGRRLLHRFERCLRGRYRDLCGGHLGLGLCDGVFGRREHCDQIVPLGLQVGIGVRHVRLCSGQVKGVIRSKRLVQRLTCVAQIELSLGYLLLQVRYRLFVEDG